MKHQLYRTIKSKFAIDVLCNYISLGILAVSGILINSLIAAFYGSAVLGRFNLLYALLIVFTQLSACGIPYSILKHLSEKSYPDNTRNTIIGSAILLGIILSCLVMVPIFFLRDIIGFLLHSKIIAHAIILIIPAFLFFSINKTLMSVLNALRHMRLFALAWACRFLLMCFYIVFIVVMKYQEFWLYADFLFAEYTLSIILLIILYTKLPAFSVRANTLWMRKHFAFGTKAILVGILMALNSRIDMLLLGLFLPNKIVGIYSFAATLASGIYQLLNVTKNNVNPLLAKYIAEANFTSLAYLLKTIRIYMYGLLFLICAFALIFYPFLVLKILHKPIYLQGWAVLTLLLTGIFFSSGFISFSNILTQAGFPGLQSIQNLLIMITNIALNVLFIYFWGMIGCAIATTLAMYFFSILYLNYFSKKFVKFNIITLKTIQLDAASP